VVIDTIGIELRKFVEHGRDVDDSAVTHQVDALIVQNTARKQMESVLVSIGNDGVTGVSATVETGAEVEVFCQDVDEFAFTFITPLTTEDDGEFRFEARDALRALTAH